MWCPVVLCLAHDVSSLLRFCRPLLYLHLSGLVLADDAWEWFAELASLDILVLGAVLGIVISAAVGFAPHEIAFGRDPLVWLI